LILLLSSTVVSQPFRKASARPPIGDIMSAAKDAWDIAGPYIKPYLNKALGVNSTQQPQNTIEDDIHKGVELAKLGIYDPAKQYFDNALTIDPTNTFALNDKGWILLIQGNFYLAKQYFNQTLIQNPNDGVALDGEGASLAGQNNPYQAAPYFDKALNQNPNDTAALDGKGYVLLGQGNYDQAAEVFNRVLNQNPNDLFAVDGIGYVQLGRQNYDQAAEVFNQVLSQYPNDGFALHGRNVALQNSNSGTSAATNATSAAATNATSAAAPVTYLNPTYGIKMQYPSNWIKNETESGSRYVEFYSPQTNSKGDIMVLVNLGRTNWGSSNLTDVLRNEINSYQDFANFRLIDYRTNTTLAGQPAFKFLFEYTNIDGVSQGGVETGTVVGSKVYWIEVLIDADQFSQYYPTAQNMIDSFVFYANPFDLS